MGDFNTTLGQRIRELRTIRSLSQDNLAERAGISVKHLGKIERGSVNASIKCLSDIASALDMPIRDMLETEHALDRGTLQTNLRILLSRLSARDMRVVYRLAKFLSES
ncbi:MAG: helix-turn-helix domain-containing protein [Desulfovibrio sp.]|jgi:transcriptional regulator with XRE-family HTH domain|nr:helix-turn-helix domain-containing protein [Desulfovibrio sp.]